MNDAKKIYTAEQGFKLAGSFFCEIYEECDELFNRKKSDGKKRSPILQVTAITKDQFENMLILGTDMNWYLPWLTEWQESIIRSGVCLNARCIENLQISSDEILRIAFDLLEFKMGYYKLDFIPILVAIRGILENETIFEGAAKLWKFLLTEIKNECTEYDFDYYQYDDSVLYDKLPPKKVLKLLSTEEKFKIAKDCDLLLKKKTRRKLAKALSVVRSL